MVTENKQISYLRKKANSLTLKPGVYLMKDHTGKVIYVGKAKALKNRVTSYFRENSGHNEKVRQMVLHVHDFDYIVTDSEFEALVLECNLIKQYDPKYNILLKDGKGYHYIKISEEEFPRLTAEKQKSGSGKYIGPYVSSYVVKQAVDEANRVYQLPTCRRKFPQEFRKGRPCLNYHIKQCMGLCRGKISKEEYAAVFSEAVELIKRGSRDVTETLQKQMEAASERLDFEEAAALRDRILALQRIAASQKIILSEEKEQDVVAFTWHYRELCVSVLKFRGGRLTDKDDIMLGDTMQSETEVRREFLTRYYTVGEEIPKLIVLDETFEDIVLVEEYFSKLADRKVTLFVPQKGEQRKLILMAQSNAREKLIQRLSRTSKDMVALDELGKLLGLSAPPDYIEAYDISNLGETARVGGMVTFLKGKPYRSGYKRFSIKGFEGQDDYASMQEVIRRRLSRYLEEKESGEGFGRLPDLILLDGGKGHVAAIQPIIAEYGLQIPVYGMVKDSRHRTRAIAKDGGEISFDAKQAAFRFVTAVQDEVHRFAITYQQSVHKRASFSIRLTECEGIGEKKAAALLKRFKTKKALKEASSEELREVAKISEEKAEQLKLFIETL
ncbi:MAG: excinuclease ABC subunit UvrC [Oscillospiraceae bacterium]|nr:excinuclease ABC subunit UvrC [Oscillospiraceae bacterium]